MESGTKNRCVIEATHVLQRKLTKKLNLELFRNVSVHKFCRLKALITLEQVSGGKKFEKIVMLGYEGPFWSKLHD